MVRMVNFAVALMMIAVLISPCIYGKKFIDHREIKVQRLLKRLNKPALKSVKSEDGDIIDCVPLNSQPALDHPLLKNHTIQMRPTYIPKGDSKFTRKEAKTISQVWHKSGECPENTAAIRRIRKEDILGAKSIESFGRKTRQSIPQDTSDDESSKVHENAIMGAEDGPVFGTKFVINTWRPKVDAPNELSSAQTWLISGGGSSGNIIEAGWQVNYGDNNIKLFVYWTSDGYEITGCYNTICPGFVQRSNRITLGGSYNQISQSNGTQYDLPFLIWKDKACGNWWLKIGDELVGYWPGSLFNSIGDGATTVQWGGEIINTRTGGRHTTTDMGSGHFANE